MIEAINYNQTKDQEYKLPCAQCGTSTYHKVLSSVDIVIGVLSAKGKDNYQVIMCQGCKEICFRKATSRPNLAELTKQGTATRMGMLKTEALFPTRLPDRYLMDGAARLPTAIFRIYRETHSALCNKQPLLSGIGIRALVESVCKDKQAGGNNLEKKIDSLVNLGLLTQDSAEFLHGLRIIGNIAAHEVKPHSEETLNAAMDIIEHLLKTVYVIPHVAKKLPKR